MTFKFNPLESILADNEKNILKWLKASSMDEVCHFYMAGMPYLGNRKYGDRVLSQDNLVGSGITTRHANRTKGDDIHLPNGIYQFQARLDKELTYIYVLSSSFNMNISEVVCKKTDYIRTLKIIRRQIQEYYKSIRVENPTYEKPILDDSLLDAVVDNTINFLDKFSELEDAGARIARGIVLSGEPGNGKTMTCRYLEQLANEKGFLYNHVSNTDVATCFQNGDLKPLFSHASLIFFDDFDMRFFDREGNSTMASALLSAMDGIDKINSIRVFTTNTRVDELDAAFLRPGRIDRIFTFDRPNNDLKVQYLDTWPEKITMDMEEFLGLVDDFSFAELGGIKTNMAISKVMGYDWSLTDCIKNVRHQFESGPMGFNRS